MPSSLPAADFSLTRRRFLAAGIKLGAAVVASPYVARGAAGASDTLNVALIGCGEEGRALLKASMGLPDIRFRAVCDIWGYHRTYGERLLKKYGHTPKPFEDYREMLQAVPEIDAVIVATPDFMHAEHTNACLRAGKHVYCEKLMANTVENARSMVRTARETGRLLQIGHQRRSNPRYRHAREKLLGEAHLLGRVTHVNGQWNRAVGTDLGWPARQALSEAVLHRYGYANMREFRNWRWFKRYAGGPISDLGAHQLDIYNWFLGATPRSVLAGGGADFYTGHEWYDNVMAIFEFPTPAGLVRAFYEVLTTTSAGGGYSEQFMGTEGALKMSEDPKYTKIFREAAAPEWLPWAQRGYIRRAGGAEAGEKPLRPWEKARARFNSAPPVVDVRETAALSSWEIPVTLDTPIHQPHLQNFFSAIRHGTPLNCPAESGFATAVTVLKVNQAVASKQMMSYDPKEFIA